MNHPNFENHHSFIGNGNFQNHTEGNSQNKTYEYVFSTGATSPSPRKPKPKRGKQGGGRVWVLLLTVAVCISCSFAAGFGGAFFANQLLKDESQESEQGSINDPPVENDLHNENPEGLLDKNESNASPYGSAGEDVFSFSQAAKNRSGFGGCD